MSMDENKMVGGQMNDLLDLTFAEMKIVNDESEGKKDFTTLSFCVTTNYKKKYADLQMKTDKDFGKRLQKLIMQAIDKVSGL